MARSLRTTTPVDATHAQDVARSKNLILLSARDKRCAATPVATSELRLAEICSPLPVTRAHARAPSSTLSRPLNPRYRIGIACHAIGREKASVQVSAPASQMRPWRCGRPYAALMAP